MINYTDITAFGQDGIDSVVKANTAAVKGFETMTKYFADYTSKTFDEALAIGKKFSTVKTPVEFFALQTKLAEESFKILVEETKTVSEMATSIVKDVTAPFAGLLKTTVGVAVKAAPTMKKAA